MADEEAEQESGSLGGGLLELQRLRERLLELESGLRESAEPAVQAATEYCQQLCQTLLEYAEKWKTSEDPLPLLEVYTVAIRSYVKARPYLTSECEKVAFVLERLALSCVELLLCLPLELPENQWDEFQAFVQVAHDKLMENGSCELRLLATLTQEKGAWKNPVLCSILSQEPLDQDKVNEFLVFEGPILLDMRIKHLMKAKQLTQATALAKLCSDHPEISTKGNFKQTYLVCLCSGSPNEKLMEEIAAVDCKDALEMICNLESDGDEKSALILCAAFLSRQLQQGEMYCAWELTLFWSKLQQRVEPSVQVYLERCRQLSVLTKTVYHIFFLIKVINSEIEAAGLATCIELCVKALRLESSENTDVKISICKTISCLLPDDLEVKRACQLSEFLLEPTVDAYYAVEMLYNQPDQKYDEENLPIPNSLRCELLLVLKTQWPFDPEFWDWKTLKRQCLALMGEEASIVSSIDELNDSEVYEKVEDCQEENKETSLNGLAGSFDEATSLLKVFQERKEDDCFSQSQNIQNIAVNSDTPKTEALTSKSLERQVSNIMPFSMQNQAGYRNNLPISKLELEDSIKSAANLYNLPLKTLESITFVPSQSSLSSSLVPAVPPAAPVQKFNCQVEGCTRTYNSSQSIGKHMKAAHPDQYAAFKMQRKNKKTRKPSNLQNMPSDGKIVYFLPSQVGNSSNAAFTSQNKTSINPACSSQLQHVSNTLFPTHLETLSNPMLPPVESVINPVCIKSEPENVLCSQMENLSNTTLPAQLEDLAKTVMPLNIDGGSDPFLPLPAESSSISLFPSPADSVPNSVFSQLENNTNNFSSQLEGNTSSVFPKEESVDEPIFSSRANSENTSQVPASEKVKKDRGRGPNGKERKPKHNKRAKWPAIIRDGKFICSRCFRVFTNPRSLGGHLSKRSVCKSIEGSEISPEALQTNGQSSLLASMILSSNAGNLQQPQESTFNPEACFKDPSFLQLLAAENRSTAFLQTMFPRANVANFNTNGNEEGNEIIKQALETAGIPSTFDNTEMLPHIVTTSCVTGTTQMNAAVLSNATVSPLLQTVCNPSTLLTNQNRALNNKIPSMDECNNLPVFATDDLILKTIENGLCSSSFSNSVAAAQNFASNSSRVSVINSPKNSGSSTLNKKGSCASKRKKKAATPLLTPNTSQKLVVNDLTAMGLLAKSIEGSVQVATDNFQSNLLANCESQVLVENLTQKLNNVDNQLLMPSVKENFKTNLESHAALAPLTIKTENGDSQMMTLNSCAQGNSDLQISEDNVIQNFEKTLEIIKTAMNSQILEVKSEMQDAVIGSTQNTQVNTTELPPANCLQNIKLPNCTQFAVHTKDVTTAKSNSSQSEMSQKDDVQVLEILEGLQKLRLENDMSSQVSSTVSHCPPADTLPPPIAVTVVSTENTSLAQPSSETSNIQFSDKVHKPFVCQDQGCDYSAMTKDALFKHYGKVHQYTAEMILEIKKHQLKYAPFKCVVTTCPKTFTRNSNLRAHCQLVHHFTTEEMVKLKIKRPYGRRSHNEAINVTPRPVEIKNLQTLIMKSKNEPRLVKGIEVKKEAVIEPVKIPEKLISEKKIPEKLEKPPQVVTVSPEQYNAASFSNTQIQPKVRKIRRHRKEKEERKRRKPVTKSLEFPTRYSPYRPYRCVHQGCFAAFTIQQNLILHYQAVHKSDLPAFSVEVEEESEPSKEERDEVETKQAVKEFRCEVSDCSRIFQEVTSLIQHYMKLHEMTPEEIGSMKSALDVGRFPCDQSQCKSSYTSYFNYILHLETDHGIKIRPNKVEEDGIYKCDCEGCDRMYATRSNLLRHIFNKHNDKHKDHLIRPRRLTPGQENISSKANQEKPIKSKHRGLKHNRSGKEGNRLSIKSKRKKNVNLESKNAKGGQIQENKAYSLKRGKNVYSIKAINDALSECTSRFVTQYPCMIKGCSSVVTSESNIIRHYKCHKLSKAFTSQHRNLLIVSKKHSVSPVKEASSEQEETNKKSDVKESDPCLSESNDDLSTSALPQSEVDKGEKDEVDELTELFITKLINEDCTCAENPAKTSSSVNSDFQETISCHSEKQKSNNLKRANKEKNLSQSKKRRVEKPEEILAVELSSMRRGEETVVAVQTTEEQPTTFDWSSFKPMGFEVSFLKFLEESAVKQKKNAERDYHSSGTKKGSHSNSRKSNEKTSLAGSNVTWSCSESETLVQFANPSQLQCSDNVKIVLDKTLKDCTELVLKQLQEMKPTVSLKKLEGHWEDDPEVTVAKEIIMGN
ncbi:zinc finger protein 292 isoform X2 [Emydura macquarii macquarii]|uniref:zinc finger protein 292 isoform X2 n=1 Tax=Emydura macquarii macquarii TaxID=1129001 RepID=UPI00352B401B